MYYINNDKYTKDFADMKSRYNKGILRWLNRYAIDVEVTRLVPEENTTIDDYAAIIGRDKMLVNQRVKAVNKTNKFNMRLAVLNQSFYNINNPVYEDIEVVYYDDLLKVGDTVTTTLGDRVIKYVINQIPKTYYDLCWEATLSPLAREEVQR